MKRQLPDLPPKVAAHVRAKLLAYDWEQQTSQLRKVCEGCPAERDSEICVYCPLEGVALSAAHVAMQAKVEKLKAKAETRKQAKSAMSKIAKKMETNK